MRILICILLVLSACSKKQVQKDTDESIIDHNEAPIMMAPPAPEIQRDLPKKTYPEPTPRPTPDDRGS